ncbi:MAG: hypothetical protein KAW14_05375 [Candidatus Aegiribacteria sp.]|nr:hypothetical protein [Candidatus Aegiribacteria sp.]
MHWLIIWMMLFSTSDDPSPVSPVLGLSVNGRCLPADRLALVVMPGDSVTLSSSDENTVWYASIGEPVRGEGNTFGWRAPRSHGIYYIDLSCDSITEKYTIIVPVESCRWRTTTLNSFPIGSYGDGYSRKSNPDYFIELISGASGARISTHFTIGQFLCRIEGNYPQYMAFDLRLADKLEAVLAAVKEVYPQASDIHNISGFRTPVYNASIGNETTESLHLYGQAADIWIESWPSNNLMDDIDRNKRVDVYDCEYLVEIVRILETEGNVITGGASAYRWISTHGPFVHIDIRGSRATWPTARTLVSDPVI